MRPYEVMVIFDTGADEAAVNGVLDRALEALRAKGGIPGRVERWGRRTFAYEVQHKREGYYVVIELTAEPAAVADLERMLRPGRRGAAAQGHAAPGQGRRAPSRRRQPPAAGEA